MQAYYMQRRQSYIRCRVLSASTLISLDMQNSCRHMGPVFCDIKRSIVCGRKWLPDIHIDRS